jgi:hypothetical protein
MKCRCPRIPTILALLSFATFATFAQNRVETSLKTVHLFPVHAHDPVVIVKLMRRGVEIQPDAPFEAGEDWLEEISVVVRNISASKVSYVSVAAHLPETGAGTQESPRVGGGDAMGRKPEHALYSPVTGQRRQEVPSESIDLQPGKELAMPLISERDYGSIKSLIQAKQTLAGVAKCDVWVTTVFFADGTKWAPAGYWRPDEARPGRYLAVSFEDWLEIQHNR